MPGHNRARNANIRLLILMILLTERQGGAAESGGWLAESLLRRFLSHKNYPLDENELKSFIDYLCDPAIGCIDRKRITEEPPYKYKVRLLARGMRVIEGSETIAGIGVGWENG